MPLPAAPIRALSLKQPWLFAIFELGKRIENRVWDTTHRGPIWLHASSSFSHKYLVEAYEWMTPRGLGSLFARPMWPGIDAADRGGVCGYAEIEGVLAPDGKQGELGLQRFREDFPGQAEEMLRWKMSAQFGFVLKNVRRFPLIPCPGRQRWFYLPPEVERAARAALEKAA